MSAILGPLLIYVFTALNYNATDNLDGGHLRFAKNMKECLEWKTAYDKSMMAMNEQMPFAFKIRWVTECRLMTPHMGDGGE